MVQHIEMVVISYMMRMMNTKTNKYEVECRYEILTHDGKEMTKWFSIFGTESLTKEIANGKEMTKWFSIFGTESLTKEIANQYIEEIKSTLTPKMGKHEYRIKEL